MPLDIGVGILLSLGVAEVFAIPVTPLLIMFGIGAALLPDIDIVTALLGRWRHRTYTHYPLLYLPIYVLSLLALPLPWTVLLILGTVAHLVHDTIGVGWGIAWLWPLSSRRFLLFPERERREHMGTALSWVPEEHPEYAHTGSHWSWIRDLYLRPTLLAITEYGVLVFSLITLFLYIR